MRHKLRNKECLVSTAKGRKDSGKVRECREESGHHVCRMELMDQSKIQVPEDVVQGLSEGG